MLLKSKLNLLIIALFFACAIATLADAESISGNVSVGTSGVPLDHVWVRAERVDNFDTRDNEVLKPEVVVTGLSYPFDLAFDHEGNLFISCRRTLAEPPSRGIDIPGKIVKIRPDYTIEVTQDTSDEFPHPGFLVVDNQLNLWMGSLAVIGRIGLLNTTTGLIASRSISGVTLSSGGKAVLCPQVLGINLKENKIYAVTYELYMKSLEGPTYYVPILHSVFKTASGLLGSEKLEDFFYGTIESGSGTGSFRGLITLSLNIQGEIFIADNEMGPAIFRQSQKEAYGYGFTTKKIWDMTFDTAGNLYVSGSNHDKPWVGDLKGNAAESGTIYKVAPGGGKGIPLLTSLHFPTGVAIHDGWLYIADYTEGEILRVKINAQPAQGW